MSAQKKSKEETFKVVINNIEFEFNDVTQASTFANIARNHCISEVRIIIEL